MARRETVLLKSGSAQADAGQTTVARVPRWARAAIFQLSVVAAAGTSPLTDYAIKHVTRQRTAAAVVAVDTAGLQNEIQTLTLTAGDEGDTFDLTFNAHESVTAVTIPAGGYASVTPAAVKATLLTISDWTTKTDDIDVTGEAGVYTIAFSGSLGASDIGAITVTSKGGAADGAVVETFKGAAGPDEVQTVTLTGGPTGGKWGLTWGGVSGDVSVATGRVFAHNESAAEVALGLNNAIRAADPEAYGLGAPVGVTRSGTGTSGDPYIYELTFSGQGVDDLNADLVAVQDGELYVDATTTLDFQGWNGITQIAGTTTAQVLVQVGPHESDTTDDTGSIYQVQAELPEALAHVITLDRTTGNEVYTYSLFATYIG